MRDPALMADTLRVIRDQGGGAARRLQHGPRDFGWYAGQQRLNGQALHDLIDDGWLSPPAGTDHTHILAWPHFADERPDK